MKPRWSECHPRANDILAKAKELEERITKAGEATEGSQLGPSHLEIETGGRIARKSVTDCRNYTMRYSKQCTIDLLERFARLKAQCQAHRS